jgi:hypothetical protein
MPVNPSAVNATETLPYYRASRGRFINRIYNFHHTRRFEWLRGKIAALGKREVSILELGCNDARSLEYVPIPVKRYVGFDAGWRSGWRNGVACGLDAARIRFEDRPQFEFRRSERCEDLDGLKETFDIAIVLETFEYLDPLKVDAYVSALSQKLNNSGSILSTMPVEKGLPLLVKAIGSRLSGIPRSGYTPRQFWNALAGRLDRVPRAVRGRRGFDYSAMAELVSRYFSHLKLEPVEPANAPLWLSLNVGLTATKTCASPQADAPMSETGSGGYL